jgi:hypothetical protein
MIARLNSIRLLATAGVLMLSACGGGSGYMASAVNTAPVINTGTNTTTNTGTTTNKPDAVDYSRTTGITGTVAIPAPASFGTSPAPAQIAAQGGPTFTSAPNPSNVSFPALATALQATANGLTAVSTNQSATVVLLGTPSQPVLQLIVPSVNLNQTYPLNGRIVSPIPLSNYPYNYGDAIAFGLSYVALGGWGQWDWGNLLENPLKSFGVFAFGYETPVQALPTTGTAVFNGVALGTAFTPVGTDIRATDVIADAAFSVDFASGRIAGAFTRGSYLGVGRWEPWNDVSVSATIAAGSNKFSGTTSVTTAPGGTFALSGAATGSINGGFYGPTAENLGALWTLSDGKTTAVGGVAAGR